MTMTITAPASGCLAPTLPITIEPGGKAPIWDDEKCAYIFFAHVPPIAAASGKTALNTVKTVVSRRTGLNVSLVPSGCAVQIGLGFTRSEPMPPGEWKMAEKFHKHLSFAIFAHHEGRAFVLIQYNSAGVQNRWHKHFALWDGEPIATFTPNAE